MIDSIGVPYGNQTRVAAVKEKRFTGIQRKPAAWMTLNGRVEILDHPVSFYRSTSADTSEMIEASQLDRTQPDILLLTALPVNFDFWRSVTTPLITQLRFSRRLFITQIDQLRWPTKRITLGYDPAAINRTSSH